MGVRSNTIGILSAVAMLSACETTSGLTPKIDQTIPQQSNNTEQKVQKTLQHEVIEKNNLAEEIQQLAKEMNNIFQENTHTTKTAVQTFLLHLKNHHKKIFNNIFPEGVLFDDPDPFEIKAAIGEIRRFFINNLNQKFLINFEEVATGEPVFSPVSRVEIQGIENYPLMQSLFPEFDTTWPATILFIDNPGHRKDKLGAQFSDGTIAIYTDNIKKAAKFRNIPAEIITREMIVNEFLHFILNIHLGFPIHGNFDNKTEVTPGIPLSRLHVHEFLSDFFSMFEQSNSTSSKNFTIKRILGNTLFSLDFEQNTTQIKSPHLGYGYIKIFMLKALEKHVDPEVLQNNIIQPLKRKQSPEKKAKFVLHISNLIPDDLVKKIEKDFYAEGLKVLKILKKQIQEKEPPVATI